MSQDHELKRVPNVDSVGWPEDEYSADLGHGETAVDAGDTTAFTRPLGHHEAPEVRDRVGKDARRITVLLPGTRLQQGSTYLDLDRVADGPFVALAGQQVGEQQLIVAKNDIDHEQWNALVGQAAPPSEDPTNQSP
jgi:hypothetical protein